MSPTSAMVTVHITVTGHYNIVSTVQCDKGLSSY